MRGLTKLVASSFKYIGFAKPEIRKILKEMDASLEVAKSQLGNNDDSHFEEEDVMLDGNIPVPPNSGTVVGDGASGTLNAMKV